MVEMTWRLGALLLVLAAHSNLSAQSRISASFGPKAGDNGYRGTLNFD